MSQLADGRGTEILDCLAEAQGSFPKVSWAAANLELALEVLVLLLGFPVNLVI